jgi:hypothetical protein
VSQGILPPTFTHGPTEHSMQQRWPDEIGSIWLTQHPDDPL